jgi:hypothetical protein
MTFILNDRVKQTISSTGTGNLTLGATSSGFISFEDGIGDNNSTYYAIENLPRWEVGIGTYSNGILTRDIILNSSDSGSRIDINISSIPSVVYCNYPATKAVALDNSGFIKSFATDYQGIRFPDETFQSTAYNGNVRTYRNISSDVTLTDQDDVVLIDTSSSDVRVILPLASSMGGKTITFKFISGTGSVNLVPQSSDQIDSRASFIIGHINQSITTFSNQGDWYII